ncbi:MAG: tetratricopeptide repeat protein [Candidatus Wallbacteria bacterium]|nr:tetratricopeptide repeat protein [Candidatus Wallbacteria bacterium]
MKKCSVCETENKKNLQFCSGCGYSLILDKKHISEQLDDLSLLFACLECPSKPEVLERHADSILEKLTTIIKGDQGDILIFDGKLVFAVFGRDKQLDFDPIFACYSAMKIQDSVNDYNRHDSDFKSHRLSCRIIVSTGLDLKTLTPDISEIIRHKQRVLQLIESCSIPGEILTSNGLVSSLKGRFVLEMMEPLTVRNSSVDMFMLKGKAALNEPRKICPYCGSENPDVYFCPSCGQKIAPVQSELFEELKQLTVLYAEINDSSAQPEDATKYKSLGKIFQALRKIIEDEEGTVIRFERNSLRAAFGLEKSTDMDPQHASYAALKMHEMIIEIKEKLRSLISPGLSLSVGIHSGKVGKGFIGNTFDIIGLAKEIAVRFGQNAGPGKTLISLELGRQLKGRFILKPYNQITVSENLKMPSFHLIGKEKVRMRRVLGNYPDFVGRRKELEYCIKKFHETVDSGNPHLTIISGTAGIGKSRLLLEFEQYCHKSELTIFVSRCFLNPTVANNYHVFKVYLLSRVKKKNEADLLNYLQKIMPDFEQEKLAEYAKVFSCLLGFEYQETDAIKLLRENPEFLARMAFKGFEDLFTTISSKNPILFLVEDFHFVDEGSLNLISHLLKWVHGKLFFLCNARPEWHDRKQELPEERFSERALHELEKPLIRRMVENILSKADSIPERIFQVIEEISLGNPFYIEELIISLNEKGIIREVGNKLLINADEIDTLEIPASLEMLIQARLEHLGKDVIRFLKKASVFGRRFSLEGIASLEKTLHVKDLLNLCVDKSIIMQDQATKFDQQNQYKFTHEIIHDVIYNKLTGIQKIELHGKAASWLELQLDPGETETLRHAELYQQLYYHYDKAQNSGKITLYAALSGRMAYSHYQNGEALKYFRIVESCLKKTPGLLPEDQLIKFLETYAEAMDIAGENAEMVEIINYFLSKFNFDAENYSRLILKKLNACHLLSDVETWSTLLDSLEEFSLKKLSDLKSYGWFKARILENRGGLCWQKGLYDEAMKFNCQALEINQEIGDRKGEAKCLHNIGLCYHNRCDYDKALDYYLQALRVNEETGDIIGLAKSLNNLGLIQSERSDYQKAREYYLKSLDLHEKIGNRIGIANAYNNMGMNCINTGKYDEALPYLEHASEIYNEIGDELSVAYVLNNIGEVFHFKGDPDRALECYRESLNIKEELGDIWAAAYTLYYMGLAYKAKNDPDSALTHFQRSLRIRKEIGDKRGIELTEKAISEFKN